MIDLSDWCNLTPAIHDATLWIQLLCNLVTLQPVSLEGHRWKGQFSVGAWPPVHPLEQPLPHSRPSSKPNQRLLQHLQLFLRYWALSIGSRPWPFRDQGRVTIRLTICWWSVWTKPLYLTGFDNQWRMWRNGWHDLKRPLNKGRQLVIHFNRFPICDFP